MAALLLLPGAARAAVTLAVGRSPGSLPIYIAQEKGWFAEEGVDVQLQECKFGKLCLELMLGGKAMLSTSSDLPLAVAAIQQRHFLVVATLNTNRVDTQIITRRSSAIHAVTDLPGRTVGTFVGTAAHHVLDTRLRLDGVDPAQVKVVNLQPDEVRTRMLAGTLDAVAVFEPFAYQTTQALGAEAVVLTDRRIYTQTWNLVAAEAPKGPSEAQLQAVLRALDRASRQIKQEPAYAKRLLKERLLLNTELVERMWPSLNFSLRLDQSLINSMESSGRWALRRGLVQGNPPDLLPFFDVKPMQKIDARRVTVVK